MKFCPEFATNSRKEGRVSLFQSNLRKQIRKLPKILKSVKIIQYYSFVSLLPAPKALRRTVAACSELRKLAKADDSERARAEANLVPC